MINHTAGCKNFSHIAKAFSLKATTLVFASALIAGTYKQTPATVFCLWTGIVMVVMMHNVQCSYHFVVFFFGQTVSVFMTFNMFT